MKRLTIILIMALAAMWWTGCENSSTAVSEDPESEINAMLQDELSEYFVDEYGFVDSDSEDDEDALASTESSVAFGKIYDENMDVWRFGRIINPDSITRSIIINIENDTAKVQVRTNLEGRFLILEQLAGDTIVRHVKRLNHFLEKKAILVKNEDPGAFRKWRLEEISGTVGNSPLNTVQIEKITVSSALTGRIYTFTDPLSSMYQIPEQLPLFPAGDVVTVRVEVSNSTPNPVELEDGSTETVLLHYGLGINTPRIRKFIPFVGTDENGNKVYENSWTVVRPALFNYHAVIDIIDNGTIFQADGVTYPYNSHTWGFPYRVIPN